MRPPRATQPAHAAIPVRPKRRTHTRSAATAALFASAALIGVLAPQASALPLPLPAAALEPLVTEGVTVEGPLVNNITLPTLK
ncbi:hypothetical protein ACFWBR_15125 [Streptomyces sp. NPDC060006]|uniref:hypothetical protein n=1 Tax=unclassified Streptomyces TaxID=2593676 RepID=UPI0036260F02